MVCWTQDQKGAVQHLYDIPRNISLCAQDEWLGYDTQDIYTGKVMGEVYFPTWFQNTAVGDIKHVHEYAAPSVFWEGKGPNSGSLKSQC